MAIYRQPGTQPREVSEKSADVGSLFAYFAVSGGEKPTLDRRSGRRFNFIGRHFQSAQQAKRLINFDARCVPLPNTIRTPSGKRRSLSDCSQGSANGAVIDDSLLKRIQDRDEELLLHQKALAGRPSRARGHIC